MTEAVEVLFLKAKAAETQGDLPHAAQIYRQIAARFPSEERARKALAEIAAQQQQQQ